MRVIRKDGAHLTLQKRDRNPATGMAAACVLATGVLRSPTQGTRRQTRRNPPEGTGYDAGRHPEG